VRVDHCHWDHLVWEEYLLVNGWIYGVDDHNLFDVGQQSISHIIRQNAWNGSTEDGGHRSWADYPYYGSEKFWFFEDNTIKGIGGISGGVDFFQRGRRGGRYKKFFKTQPKRHGTEGWPQRGMRVDEIYKKT